MQAIIKSKADFRLRWKKTNILLSMQSCWRHKYLNETFPNQNLNCRQERNTDWSAKCVSKNHFFRLYFKMLPGSSKHGFRHRLKRSLTLDMTKNINGVNFRRWIEINLKEIHFPGHLFMNRLGSILLAKIANLNATKLKILNWSAKQQFLILIMIISVLSFNWAQYQYRP